MSSSKDIIERGNNEANINIIENINNTNNNKNTQIQTTELSENTVDKNSIDADEVLKWSTAKSLSIWLLICYSVCIIFFFSYHLFIIQVYYTLLC